MRTREMWTREMWTHELQKSHTPRRPSPIESASYALCARQRSSRFATVASSPRANGSTWWNSKNAVAEQRLPHLETNEQRAASRRATARRTARGIVLVRFGRAKGGRSWVTVITGVAGCGVVSVIGGVAVPAIGAAATARTRPALRCTPGLASAPHFCRSSFVSSSISAASITEARSPFGRRWRRRSRARSIRSRISRPAVNCTWNRSGASGWIEPRTRSTARFGVVTSLEGDGSSRPSSPCSTRLETCSLGRGSRRIIGAASGFGRSRATNSSTARAVRWRAAATSRSKFSGLSTGERRRIDVSESAPSSSCWSSSGNRRTARATSIRA